ncbi:MAG: hypothetical protein M0011_12060 [Elusimicrobia bacterium]|nr:hypothetical protein [Elusimicrobiota bacterium]
MACVLRTSVILPVCLCLSACSASVPMRVARINGELFFVLEGKPQVESVTVERDATPWSPAEKMWLAGCSAPDVPAARSSGAKAAPAGYKCSVHQIKYGEGGEYLPSLSFPRSLTRGLSYTVRVELAGPAAAESSFMLEGDNSISVTGSAVAASHIKGVTLETSSGELFYPYEVSVASEAGRVVLTAGSPRTVVPARKKPVSY